MPAGGFGDAIRFFAAGARHRYRSAHPFAPGRASSSDSKGSGEALVRILADAEADGDVGAGKRRRRTGTAIYGLASAPRVSRHQRAVSAASDLIAIAARSRGFRRRDNSRRGKPAAGPVA